MSTNEQLDKELHEEMHQLDSASGLWLRPPYFVFTVTVQIPTSTRYTAITAITAFPAVLMKEPSGKNKCTVLDSHPLAPEKA
ncbi:hypothetical protein FKM82_006041 [Ascaphus truei]